MRTHVFIVNDRTFCSHLQYLFAGTGVYNRNRKIWLDEHIGLLSDIKRVRPGDFVIFYIEATTKVQGGFFGIFRIANHVPSVFHVPGESGFQPNLEMKLIYRTLLEPYEVYSEGVPEWEALDKLPVYATELQWSLIYRKLKAKRGCTPLLPWESQRLIEMIRNKNNGTSIADQNYRGGFDWDTTHRRILLTSTSKHLNLTSRETINPLPIICEKIATRKAYEVYLQLYFTQTIGINSSLNPIVGNDVHWFGNEVACGVSMQKIDILTTNELKKRSEYRVIELKDEPVDPAIVGQLQYYVTWASQNSGRHLDGAYNWNIRPVIVAPPHKFKKWQDVARAFRDFNDRSISLPILYFEFQLESEKIIRLQSIDYEKATTV